jgi:hypothetical protein
MLDCKNKCNTVHQNLNMTVNVTTENRTGLGIGRHDLKNSSERCAQLCRQQGQDGARVGGHHTSSSGGQSCCPYLETQHTKEGKDVNHIWTQMCEEGKDVKNGYEQTVCGRILCLMPRLTLFSQTRHHFPRTTLQTRMDQVLASATNARSVAFHAGTTTALDPGPAVARPEPEVDVVAETAASFFWSCANATKRGGKTCLASWSNALNSSCGNFG